jgi:hypothetical protein
MLIDIVILLPQNFRKKFGKLGVRLKSRFPVFYAVDDKKLIPHLSLLHMRTDKADLIAQLLEAMLDGYKSFAVYPKRFVFQNKGRAYISGGLEIKKSSALQDLHEFIVRQLHKLKSGPAFKPEKYYNKKQEYYRIHYGGNPFMLEFYGPHLTLAKLKMLTPQQLSEFSKILKVKFAAFKAGVVAVAQTDKNHQVIKILKQFKLK